MVKTGSRVNLLGERVQTWRCAVAVRAAQKRYRDEHERVKIMTGGTYIFDRVLPKGVGRGIRLKADAFRAEQRSESLD